MKKYHINLTYIGDDDSTVILKFMKLIDSIEGASIDTLSIEDASDSPVFNLH